MKLFLLALIFAKIEKFLNEKEAQSLKKECLLWAQVSDFNSVKVGYSHIVMYGSAVWFLRLSRAIGLHIL